MSFRIGLMIVALILVAASLKASLAPQALFDEQPLLHITVDLPYSTLTRNRFGEPEYKSATISYVQGDESIVSLPVDIRTRGRTRRTKNVCDFPPLRVRFDSNITINTWFENQNALKLVTHCKDKGSYDRYVMLEYLAYKMYNLLSDHGLRARLVRVNYVEGKRKIATRYGFFLENWRLVAARNGVTAAEVYVAIRMASLSAPDMNRVAVFQYLIGNEDWSAIWPENNKPCCHNMKPLLTAAGKVIPLPYDFDYSGIVDAPYAHAIPPNNDVRRRRYRGLCVTQTDLAETLPLFLNRKRQFTI